MSDDENLPAIPPLALEELEEELFKAENKAQIAYEDAVASRFLASNLLLALHQSGVLDGHRLLHELGEQVNAQSSQSLPTLERRVCEGILEELKKMLLVEQTDRGVH